MWQWIGEHSGALNAILGFGTLIVWLAYLQIFVASYRRQRRPVIMITIAGGAGLDASCLVSNMSQEPLYVMSAIARLLTDDGLQIISVTDETDRLDGDPGLEILQRTRQGPLRSGETSDIGTFASLLARAAPEWSVVADAGRRFTLELIIIADYASENTPVAAKRRFTMINGRDGCMVVPQTVMTQQVRSRRERREVWRLLSSTMSEGGR